MKPPLDTTDLKEKLWAAINGQGRLHEALVALRDMAIDRASDAREVLQDEQKAFQWETLAKTLALAAHQSIPFLGI